MTKEALPDSEVQVSKRMFIIVYCRIVDNKKKGIELEGPYFGPECETMDLAHQEAKTLNDASRDMTLIRIYPLGEYTHETAKQTAMAIFDGLYDNMLKAASIIERPSSRSRRKKKKTKNK